MNHKDLLLGTDVGITLQGHVSQNIKQVFETLTAVPFYQPRLKLHGYEFLLKDQFENYYHKMRAVLFDGEMYDVDQAIKPSMMMSYTGAKRTDFDSRPDRSRLRITEDLMKELREIGAVAFGSMNLDIAKARSLSTSPVAIETRDITHQANVLEDAVRAARLKEGDRVIDEPTPPDDFKPVVKPKKAKKGSKLAQVVEFDPSHGLTAIDDGPIKAP